MEYTLGGRIQTAAILDRDFRSQRERNTIIKDCQDFCNRVTIHAQKEIENYLLVPNAIDRAAAKKLADRGRRTGKSLTYVSNAREILNDFAADRKDNVMAQHVAAWRRFEKATNAAEHDSVIMEAAMKEFNECWTTFESRMGIVPGKAALSYVNQKLQEACSISVTPSSIIDSMHVNEIPVEMKELIKLIDQFAAGGFTA